LFEIFPAFKPKKSLIHFCFKASFKAEKHLIQTGKKDPQHYGQILEFPEQKGWEQVVNSKSCFHCKPKGKELHLTPEHIHYLNVQTN
jgi:hypothetical protein